MAPVRQQEQPIAIVGMSCTFAGDANSPSGLWEVCEQGKAAWSPIPPQRFDARSFYHPDQSRLGRSHVVGGYFLDQNIASFDADFFSLTSEVAAAMDPQLRLLLESVYEALENAGIPLEKIAGTDTSVFTGCWSKDYQELLARDPDALPPSFLTGNGIAMLSNRISHFFDLQGPSMSIDTGCSAGLVAVHQACRSILWGESDMSIVAASNLLLNSDLFVALSNLRMTGADGKCYAWDSRAHGYGRAEGVAALVLKPLDAALRDGDNVHALIRGTGLNQDGKTRTITSPSVAAQIRLIEQCYECAGLEMSETGYVEAHMTGTLVGDVAEAEALGMTFGKSRARDDPVYVGSVKTNIGHTEPVSGLAAIIKTAWAMKKQQIPPNLNYETTNSRINMQEWNLRIPTALTPWPENKPLRASINNFGYGGSNAHLILEAAPDAKKYGTTNYSDIDARERIFVVSAKSSTTLGAIAARLAKYVLALRDDKVLGDLAYTLSERRSRLPISLAVRATNRNELATRLDPQLLLPHLSAHNRPPRLGFVFNGQGGQWYAMGRELMKAHPIFNAGIQRADQSLRDIGSKWSLRDELMRDANSTRVSEVNFSQPLTTALQLCLVDLLRCWGVTPVAVTSHSSGEIAAAYAADRLSFDEALAVAYWRGQLAVQNTKLMSLRGGMLAVRDSPEGVAKYLADTTGGKVMVACVNSPESVTLSGDTDVLEEVQARLHVNGVSSTKLNVPLAYHSHHMLSMEREYTEKLRSIFSTPTSSRQTSEIVFSSPVSGDVVPSSEALSAEHWSNNMQSPVLFHQALEHMCFTKNGSPQVDMVIEVGAHNTLAGPIRRILHGRDISYAFCLQKSVDSVETMHNLACELVNRGYQVSLPAINAPLHDHHLFLHDLPTYAWDHTAEYWIEPRISKEMRHKKFPPHELLGCLLPGGNGMSPTWRNILRLGDCPWLLDYQIDSRVVLPAAAYLVMAIEAVRLVVAKANVTPGQFQLREVEILDALEVPESSAGVETQFNLCPSDQGAYNFTLSSFDTDADLWLVKCTGFISPSPSLPEDQTIQASFSDRTPKENRSTISVHDLFSHMTNLGVSYGPAFRNLEETSFTGTTSVTKFRVPNIKVEAQDYFLHPIALESVLQPAYWTAMHQQGSDTSSIYAQSIRCMSICSNFSTYGGETWQTHVETHKPIDLERSFTSEVTVVPVEGSQSGLCIIRMNDFTVRAITRNKETEQSYDQQTEPPTSRIKWQLDAWHCIPASIKDSMRINLNEEEAAFEKKMVRLSYYLIHDAVDEIKATSGQESIQRGWQKHHHMLYDWMKETVARGESGLLAARSKAWSRASRGAKQLLIDEMAASDESSAMLTLRVGKELARIVIGEVEPLELMMQGNLLHQYYMDLPKLKERTYKHLEKVAQLLASSRPGVKVLEIGAGTGGATQVVLEAFSVSPSMTFHKHSAATPCLLEHYTFTDVSPAFFASAKNKLASWKNVMEFRRLDIEGDLEGQGFDQGSYDVIVASLVLHATESLHKTMANVRKLLKPGGKLLLIETTTDSLELHLIFGTLPGWWLSKEPDRKRSPNVSLRTWDRILRDTGFGGVEFEIGDCEDPELQCTSLIVTTATAASPDNALTTCPSSITVVHTQAGTLEKPSAWIQDLCEALHQRLGVTPHVANFDAVATRTDWSDTVCIFAAEMDGPLVHCTDQNTFEKLRSFLATNCGLMWLSCGGSIDAEQPFFAATQGLLRTLRQEDAGKRCVQLDFQQRIPEDGGNWTNDKISHIVDVFQHNFTSGQDWDHSDSEFSVKDSMLYVPRLYPDSVDAKDPTSSNLPSRSFGDSARHSTYLVIGGVRGLGREVVRWMVHRGAKHVLIVSRTMTEAVTGDDECTRLISEACERGCNIQFRGCDVSDEKDLLQLLVDCSTTLPPIRGVINAAMVLDDTLLERMTWSQWRRALRAKIDTSMNLHNHVPNLDFFVLLSSITGVVGHSSQANYAAGSAFQDALARHRRARGLPAVALDLSAVRGSVGWVARNTDAWKRIEHNVGAASLSIVGVISLLERAIFEDMLSSDGQVIVGLWRYADIPEEAMVTKRDRRFGTLRLAPDPVQGEGGQQNMEMVEYTKGATAAACAKNSMARLLVAAKNGRPEWRQLLVDAVTNKIASIFNDKVGPAIDTQYELPFAQLGIDSLIAVNLRSWLSHRLKASVLVSEITQAASISSFSTLVSSRSELLRSLVADIET